MERSKARARTWRGVNELDGVGGGVARLRWANEVDGVMGCNSVECLRDADIKSSVSLNDPARKMRRKRTATVIYGYYTSGRST